ncbi:MAG TPA: lysophospholipid acyltransferase family protein [Bacillus sp. (in: firmicutes)]|uniref:lysophospholipid acyltransferase family protein n=1 Tax=Bacillus litorisediminis TaxID=2922713 RepID=UPI001FABA40B|nr:lysophospholipid acyltransferase family protein [Bacillus litorisediminis]HWO75116.1 lysophospholipid acyltransferase family protein [Bacillus sp. (in: firmicutes)]
MYQAAKKIAIILFRIFGRIHTKNKHLLPDHKGYIVACTHEGWLEIVALGIVLPKPIHFMAKKELFQNRIIDFFLKKLNAFPVNRENPGPSSIKQPIKLLKAGEVVGIFPSGMRTSEDVSLKRGAVTIANLAQTPIVPAYYQGPFYLKELIFSRKRPTIIFGEPFYVNITQKEDFEKYTDYLNQQIQYLKEQLQ